MSCSLASLPPWVLAPLMYYGTIDFVCLRATTHCCLLSSCARGRVQRCEADRTERWLPRVTLKAAAKVALVRSH